MSLDGAQLYALAVGAGFAPSQARIMAAIALGESGGNPGAVGDEHLTSSTWGPSIGLWQVRSLRAHRGTGRERDELILTDPRSNARSARIIYGQQGFSAWTVYSTGAYGKHLTAVDRALAGSSSSGSSSSSGLAGRAGDAFVGALPGGGLLGKVPGVDSIGGAAGGAVSGVVDGIDNVGAFFGALGQRGTWVRVVQVLGGAGLIVGGLAFLGRDIARPAVSAAADFIPAGRAIKAAGGVAKAAGAAKAGVKAQAAANTAKAAAKAAS